MKKNSDVLRFYLYYGKEYSRCMCETKDDFTNEQLAVILDEIIDRYYSSSGNLIEKEKLEQEQKMAEMNLSASSKTYIDEDCLKDAAQKAEAKAIWEKELQLSQLNAAKWKEGGIFDKYTPKDEIQSLRTQCSKKFKNPDGSITAQIGGNYHYADESGAWKDIDFTIEEKAYGDFHFSNTTNTFKSYFPKVAGSQGYKIENKNVNISLWINPEVIVTDNKNKVVYHETANKNSKADLNANILKYNSFNGIVDELKIIDDGIENNIYINSINPAWDIANSKTISFKQSVKFNSEVEVLNSKLEKQVDDFEDELVAFKFANGEIVFLNKLIVFDNNTDKDKAELYFVLKENNKLSDELKRKANSFYKGNYKIKFVEGGVEIYSDLDINWLKNAQLPICVDPTWTIGSTSASDIYGPVTHNYDYQRHAQLYLQSEIGGYGTITQIEYYKANSTSTRTNPTKIYMRSTNLSSLAGQTGMWNSATYTGGLTPLLNGNTTQDNTIGWKPFPLSSFNYVANNLLIMVYDARNGAMSQRIAQHSASSMSASNRADYSDPGDAVNMVIDYKRHTIRITYEHCTPNTGGGSTYYISNFTTTGGTTNINNSSGGSASGYQDFYNTEAMSAEVGATINYSITCSGGSYGRAIWVDWNDDGMFDASEKMASSTVASTSPLTGSFTVPTVIVSGPKRMRILASNSPSNPNNPCINSGAGEYEDYKFIVIGNPCASITAMSCDVEYTAILSPNSGDWTNYTDVSNSYSGLEEIWSFTPTTTGIHTFNVNEGSADADFFLMSACNPSSTNLSNGYWSGNGGTSHSVVLTEGVTYYLIADLLSNLSSTTVTVSVDCPACIPTTTGGTTHYISNFTTTGGTININKSSDGSASGYQDFYETDVVFAKMNATINYYITVAGGSTYGRAIWVDWNENGMFEAPEKMASSTVAASSPLAGSFTIPVGTLPGTKRMRILATPTNNPNEPCGNNDVGEYEDYKFIVLSDEIVGSGYCESAVAFCASNESHGYNFEITSEYVPYPPGQCHFLKNPSWWYMQIAEAGNVVLKIASSCGDVDYSCYGPFNNPTCDSTDLSATGTFPYYYGNHKVTYHKSTHPGEPIDHSTTETPFCKVGTLAEPVGNLVDFGASISDVEYLQIFNANVGEYYVVIIGNYARCAGTVDFSQTNIGQPGAASLNCDIVSLCNITSVTVTPTYNYGSTHSVSGNINFINPPVDGLLKICQGTICQTFTPPFVSPQAYTLTGIPSDTTYNTMQAEFTSTTVNCTRPVNYILHNLPIKLISLFAECNNNGVLISWTTASEINNDYFEIQRSKNDIDWEVIAKVKGAGFSNTIKNYKYLDKESPNASFYYRLRQVDYDGKSQLSDIISIRCENIIEKTEVSIYPNPFNSKLNIEFKNWDSNVAEIELLDLTSRVIQKWNLQNTLSSFVHEVNLSNLNPSIYVIKIKTSDGVIIRKVEKR